MLEREINPPSFYSKEEPETIETSKHEDDYCEDCPADEYCLKCQEKRNIEFNEKSL